MTMRVSEVYASAQGEGPNVGKTTVFLRFGGCNLRCPGWPCDTEHAINPAFRNEWTKYEPTQLLDEVIRVADMAGAKWITLTGGEPFLQPKKDLEMLVSSLFMQGYEVEAFSNGTILYPQWALDKVSFIMDWKLPGSGETRFGPLNETRLKNLEAFELNMKYYNPHMYRPHQAVKFVIKDWRDLQAAHGLWVDHLKDAASHVEVFYGKVWEGTLEDSELVAYVMKNGLPWRLNRQEHNYIWPPNERGR